MTMPGPWRKSRRSNPSGNCVVARFNGQTTSSDNTEFGDSKLEKTPVLTGGAALVHSVKHGLL